jgi:hypothetical protein
MSHRQLITALGNGTQVADWMRAQGQAVDREAVYKWASNGVPWRWRPYIAKMASEKGVRLPKNFAAGPQ